MGLLLARVLVAGVFLIEGARAFKRKRCILERKVFAAIATNVGQKESGSCPTVVVEGGMWWEGEVCRSGEGMWDSAGNGGMCDVSSCTTLAVCHNRPLLRSWCLYIYLQLTLI